MTCIVGIEENSKVYIGGDSLGSINNFKDVYDNNKVFKLGNKIICGTTGSYRMNQLLKYQLKLEELTTDVMPYMVNEFIPKVIELFKNNGFEWTENGRIAGGEFLIGINGTLCIVQSDYSILIPSAKQTTIGSGEEYAFGSLVSTENMGITPRKRITMALKAAERHTPSVQRPFTILKV